MFANAFLIRNILILLTAGRPGFSPSPQHVSEESDSDTYDHMLESYQRYRELQKRRQEQGHVEQKDACSSIPVRFQREECEYQHGRWRGKQP